LAQIKVVVLTDDLDGDDIPQGQGETIRFGIDGQGYEIDLKAENAEVLKGMIEKYIAAGRRINPQSNGKPRRARRPREIADPRSRCLACGRLGRISKGAWRDFTNNSTACPKTPDGKHQLRGSAPAPAAAPAPDFDPGPTAPDPKAVRIWARSKGIPVPERGRVPQDIVAQFRAAGY
jgi:hypothetical protein